MTTIRPFVLVAAALVAGCTGCTRGGSGSGDAGADGAAASAQPAPSLSATAVASATLTSSMAESLGIQIAKKRWPQYHARMASAQRIPDGHYIVRIQMLESGVGANVVIDMQGNFIDGGTSNGEH